MALVFAPSLAISATIAGGTITTDTTWTLAQSPYIITGTVTVQGVDGADGITTLTIEPGVELRFNAGKYLYVGDASGNPGALQAIGNESQPIVFTSNETSPWYGINFRNTASDPNCVMEHCVIEKSGQSNIRIDSASPAIRHCSIRESNDNGIHINIGTPEIRNTAITLNNNYGIYCTTSASKPVLAGNTFTANGSYPLRIGANTTFSDSTFIGNTIQAVEIISETITLDKTWINIGVSYHVTGNITVQGIDGADGVTTLTIEPGVDLRFNPNTNFTIGNTSGNPGSLRAIGETGNPITFSTLTAEPWYGINFQNTTHDSTSIINHCIIEKASNVNILIDSANPSIKNSIIRNSGAYGIHISSGVPEITGNSIINNTGYGVYCSSQSSKPILTGNTFTTNGSYPLRIGANTPFCDNSFIGNTIQAVEVLSETITFDKTWKNIGVSYHMKGDVRIQGIDGSDGVTTLTIEPGVELRFNPNTSLTIGNTSGNPGSLRAIGETGNPITFSNLTAEPWYGINFQNTTHDSTSIINHCIIEKASNVNILIDSANPAIKNSTIRNSGGYGIYIKSGSPEISNNSISFNNNYGLFCLNSNSKPFFISNIFDSNGSYPVRVYASTKIDDNIYKRNTVQAIELIGTVIILDSIWKNIGIPYHITSDITVQGTDGADGVTTLSIEPGAELLFNANVCLYIGNSTGSPGAISAVGSENQPVIFSSNQSSPWNGINFRNTTSDSQSILDYCIVEKAANINIKLDSASPTIRSSTIKNSRNYGIYLNGAGCNTAVIECSTIQNNLYGIYTVGCSQMNLINNNITDNSLYGIYHTNSSILNAVHNWWGIKTGPGSISNKVYGNMNVSPYLIFERNCNILHPTEDTDYDYLPDSWELQYFGNLNHNYEDDYDNDGLSNGIEYFLGNIPNDMNHIIPVVIDYEYDGSGRIQKIKRN